ncbi:MAG: hypothetical protein E5Y02_20370 [Mesorhizobium sp.]|nr:MAG: hypothetical protein E5Y02_20370 [Mesorhizobium sp.]
MIRAKPCTGSDCRRAFRLARVTRNGGDPSAAAVIARLRGARLQGARLRGARLRGTRLRRAGLRV